MIRKIGPVITALFAAALEPTFAMAAESPALATGQGVEIPVVRMLLALVVCVAVCWGVLLFLKTQQRLEAPGSAWVKAFRGARPKAKIAVVESRKVSTYAEVSLIECDGRRYLVASAAGQLLQLDTLEPHDGEQNDEAP